jgi:pimeloyl-ACP methyl ester carboxylesterase
MAGWILPLQRTLPGRLAKWRIPTRVIWGEKDLITSPMNGAALAQIQPFTQFKAIPGAGHNVQQDAPQALLEEILTALSA